MSMQKENSPTEQKTKPYTFAQRQDDDYSCIKLTEGKYSEIIFKYGNVGFKEVENSEKLSVIFDYNILKNPSKVDIDEQEFIDHIGDILIELLEEQMQTGKLDLNFEDINEW